MGFGPWIEPLIITEALCVDKVWKNICRLIRLKHIYFLLIHIEQEKLINYLAILAGFSSVQDSTPCSPGNRQGEEPVAQRGCSLRSPSSG